MSGATEEVTTAALGLVPLFHRVDEAALATLIRESSSRHLEAGEWLFHEGDDADRLFVVLSGRLRIVVTREQRAEDGEGARPGSGPRRAGAPDRIRALGRGAGGARLPTARDRPPVVRRPARRATLPSAMPSRSSSRGSCRLPAASRSLGARRASSRFSEHRLRSTSRASDARSPPSSAATARSRRSAARRMPPTG